MANDKGAVEPGIHDLTDAEAKVIFDNAARHYLNMSGDDFLRAWKDGRFQNGACTDDTVEYLLMLLPLVEHR